MPIRTSSSTTGAGGRASDRGAAGTLPTGLLGRGDATITVPSFDGALKPNQILEKAETVAQFDAPEDLATDGKALYLADGAAHPAPRRHRHRPRSGASTAPITALCCLPDGGIAVALDGREVQVFATPSATSRRRDVFRSLDERGQRACAGPDGTLIATDGSTTRGPTGNGCTT